MGAEGIVVKQQDMIRPTHCYIGRCPDCNEVLSSVYDMVDDPKFTAKCVSNMVAGGLRVERVPMGSFEISIDGCACRAIPTVGTLPLFSANA